ncbi:hypothetical protein [Actinophytocola sp.]|uniref:hypothetical protein n=1 Tax=Actinophytocola sp. TaxID=1872138 RepID=UPI003D6BB3E8
MLASHGLGSRHTWLADRVLSRSIGRRLLGWLAGHGLCLPDLGLAGNTLLRHGLSHSIGRRLLGWLAGHGLCLPDLGLAGDALPRHGLSHSIGRRLLGWLAGHGLCLPDLGLAGDALPRHGLSHSTAHRLLDDPLGQGLVLPGPGLSSDTLLRRRFVGRLVGRGNVGLVGFDRLEVSGRLGARQLLGVVGRSCDFSELATGLAGVTAVLRMLAARCRAIARGSAVRLVASPVPVARLAVTTPLGVLA